jgi:hypothetical protein
MLFYERRASKDKKESLNHANTPGCSSQTAIDFVGDMPLIDSDALRSLNECTVQKMIEKSKRKSLLSKELEDWIWQDNRHYLEDRNIFEHTYFK